MQTINTPITKDAFRGLVQRNQAAGRLSDKPQKARRTQLVQSGMRLMPQLIEEIREYAALEGRAGSNLMVHVFVPAWLAYKAKVDAEAAAKIAPQDASE